MTPDAIDARLRELGIPDEYTARTGREPRFLHVRENGQTRTWYATTPLGVLMLKSDLAVMAERGAGRVTIELGRG